MHSANGAGVAVHVPAPSGCRVPFLQCEWTIRVRLWAVSEINNLEEAFTDTSKAEKIIELLRQKLKSEGVYPREIGIANQGQYNSIIIISSLKGATRKSVISKSFAAAFIKPETSRQYSSLLNPGFINTIFNFFSSP